MEKFTIITVCLNAGQGIRRTCDSIAAQTFHNYEWIVIDGHSTDGTLDVLAEYGARISALVSEPDAGIYDAMNKGIGLATGEYLLFLNAGDYLMDADVLETVARAPDRDLLFGDLLCLEADGGQFLKAFPDVLQQNFLLRKMMPHQAAFFRRELFEKFGGYDQSFKIAGDYDLFVRLLHVHKVSYFHVPRVLAVFTTDGVSSSRSQRMVRKKENHLVRKNYFSWLSYGLKGLKAEFKLRSSRRN